MRPVGVAVVRSGLVTTDTLTELRRWGLPVVEMPMDSHFIEDHKQMVDVIRDALEDEEQVAIRDTELDILRRWMDADLQRQGKLTLRAEDRVTSVKVVYSTTFTGECIIPWKSETIREYMTDPGSYLKPLDSDDASTARTVHFEDVREVYLGDRKVFMVCTPIASDRGKL